MSIIILRIAALMGFLTVALGAFGAHALKGILDDYSRSVWEKAVLYQGLHTLVLIALVPLIAHGFIGEAIGKWIGGFFVGGILLFSGSLYILAVTRILWLGAITPLGGTCFLLGWLLLLISARPA